MLGGTAGYLVADSLKHALNPAGTAVVLFTSLVVSTYLVSTFTLAKLEAWFSPLLAVLARLRNNWRLAARDAVARKRLQAAEALRKERYEEETAALAEPALPDPAQTRRTRRQPAPADR